MNTLLFTVAFCYVIQFSVTIRNHRGCEDDRAEYMHLVLPPECITMNVTNKVCTPTQEPPPFTVHAELNEHETVKVSFGNEYGDYGSIPISHIALAAEDASKPYVKIGNFVGLQDFEKEELTIWCCDLQSDHNMISVEKEYQDMGEANFKWVPGGYKGRVIFFATVISGDQCFRSLRSNILTFPSESKKR
ncbi:unnamed protein product [Allacma fusca]|uniref:Reelin domain-containing protein n=1 Tax=Allacma fusca TaxID=39272 RepID=A0A8J2JRI9_9HEXA|nr:unnamed protein product [Allacma fusca]